MTTLNTINKMLRKTGIEMYKQDGYYSIAGRGAERNFSTSVLVPTLRGLTEEFVINEVVSLFSDEEAEKIMNDIFNKKTQPVKENQMNTKSTPKPETRLSAKKVEAILNEAGIYPDSIFKSRKGYYVAKWSFFYQHGRSADQYADKVRNAEFEITDYQCHWNAWPKDSWFEVQFQLP